MEVTHNVRSLYRRILKAATRFPSVKRDGIIQDIKVEFRENKVSSCKMYIVYLFCSIFLKWCWGHTVHFDALVCLQELKDDDAIRKKVQVGLRSLEELESYANMSSSSAEWSKTLRGSCE